MIHSRPKKQAQPQKENEPGDFSGCLVTALNPMGAASEAYRALRTNLLFAVVDVPPEVILITSSCSAEGKSTTCANLGVVLAQAGKRTLIIDGDLRKPSMHSIFGISDSYGLADLLIGKRSLSEPWEEPLPGLNVVSSSPMPLNPTELLSSDRFVQIIGQARRLFDYVLIDSPPTELVADPMIIAARADAALLVLDSRTRMRSLRKAVHNLEAVGANVLGTVMNNVGKKRQRRPSKTASQH